MDNNFDFAQAFADGVLLEHLTGVSPSQYVNQEMMKSITGIGEHKDDRKEI